MAWYASITLHIWLTIQHYNNTAHAHLLDRNIKVGQCLYIIVVDLSARPSLQAKVRVHLLSNCQSPDNRGGLYRAELQHSKEERLVELNSGTEVVIGTGYHGYRDRERGI